jgi:eukaryotic-like serine/threonine-protein kinase
VSEREIFDAALAFTDPAKRSDYLDGACAGDRALRKHIEDLLEMHGQLGSFLESPAPAHAVTSGPSPSPEKPGAVIGRYKLLQQIGEGGMGTVYMAEQTQPVHRKVALKLIKPDMDSRQVIARFEAERQALALMDHPNIAKVLDAGTTESGRPYFVMELVKGVPVTRYCDEHHLAPKQRLELFVPVCQAVQHAHQKGVIHRDLKPSNVLVCLYDGKPVPKVIDFGVAKAAGPTLTERTLFTELGQVVGTLEYMSPEQAELNQLDVDTRSDIYSLGVLLYELLTGTTPLDRRRLKEAAFLEVLRLIREEEPPRPSTRLSTAEGLSSIAANRGLEPKRLTGLMRGELDWIVMKSLDKDRNRRYETANAFVADVLHYLNDESVLACPPSATYRLRKFARRNKGPVLTGTIIFALLLGGIVGTTWGLVRAQRARLAEADRAEGERQAKQEALAAAAAERNAKETAQTREAETRAVLDFVENRVLAAARPENQEGGLGREVTLRKAVQAALPFVDKSFTKLPLIEARLRLTLGRSFWYLGEWKISTDQYQTARTLYSGHLGPDHPDTLRCMNNLAVSYSGLGRYADALMLHEQTLTLRKAKLGPDHPDTLSSMMNVATSYARLGREADALMLREQTLALRKAKLGPDHPDTLWSMNYLANSYLNLGRYPDAVKLNEETLALRKAKLGPDHPDTLRSMSDLAASYSALGSHAAAIKLQKETLALRKAKLGPDHPDTLWTMHNLAMGYSAFGRYADALKLFEETLMLKKAKLGPNHRDTLTGMNDMAWLLVTCPDSKFRDPSRAVELAKKAVELGPKQGSYWNTLGIAQYRAGDWKAAVAALEKSMEFRKGGDANDWFFLTMAHWQLGDKKDARKWYDQAVQWMEKNQPKNEELIRFRAEAEKLLGVK